ncbi:MAG: 16S rRNA processing protein RimM [Deltaproteobacteria bacterium]|nr:16S rRNA processing protein RimM [Deltaproteobacteria bacterium]MBN2687671.1 16S rRNA processing protein RimM [Deltaproteobacteria bacterium]
MKRDLLKIGTITKPVGFRGRLKVVSYIESPQILDSLQEIYIKCGDRDPVAYGVRYVSFTSRHISLELSGVTDGEAARLLRGCDVFVSADRLEKLPDGEYYWHDIIGLRVITRDGRTLGTIDHVFETGSNDVYVCTGGDREILLPAIEDVILHIDIDRGVMIVDLLEGL